MDETFGRRRDIPSGQLILNRGSKSLFPSVFRKESPQNVSCSHDETASALYSNLYDIFQFLLIET